MAELLFEALEQRSSPPDPLLEGLGVTGRYDLALGLIPTAFVASLVVSVTTDLRLVRALVPAALVGIAVIADVCYLNPPVDEE